jgi:hypothetical protein
VEGYMDSRYLRAAKNLAWFALNEACCETMHHSKADRHGSEDICPPLERIKKDVEAILGKSFDELKDI